MNNKESFREQQRKQLNIKIAAVNNNNMNICEQRREQRRTTILAFLNNERICELQQKTAMNSLEGNIYLSNCLPPWLTLWTSVNNNVTNWEKFC